MKGTDLFDAMGQIDEEFVQEATEPLKRKAYPVYRIAAVAACLCLLFVGVMLWPWVQYGQEDLNAPGGIKPAMTPIDADTLDGNDGFTLALPENVHDTQYEYEPDYGQSGALPTETGRPSQAMEPGDRELYTVVLKVQTWDGEQILATVHAHGDTDCIPLGTQVKVALSRDCVISVSRDAQPQDQDGGTAAGFEKGTLIEVQFYAYEDGWLYVSAVCPVN